MKNDAFLQSEFNSRRSFLKRISTGLAGLTIGSLNQSNRALSAEISGSKDSNVSFAAGNDTREVIYQALKPLEREIEKAIGDKQVVIKVNMGEVIKGFESCATDVNQIRGILDFLKPIYDKRVIIAEGTANYPENIVVHFEKRNYNPLLKEYNAEFIDTNDQPATTKWIKSAEHHPLPINIINTFFDPDIYLISATRLKTHDCVVATLSLKNVVMGAPIHYYKQKNRTDKNEKRKMHSGGYRGLSYNIFRVATLVVQPDLAVLDGVIGVEGNGPWNGSPIEHGVALASTDWVSADRMGVELMGIDYDMVKYLQWCSATGMGQGDLSKINVIGPNYKDHIVRYKLNKNIEQQCEWIYEDFKDIKK